jgi:IS5 family transposase
VFGYKITSASTGRTASSGARRSPTPPPTTAAPTRSPARPRQPGERRLGGGVWADTAYRSQANLALLERGGPVAQFQRAKPRGKPMPAHIRRGNATRGKVRAKVEHVFAMQKRRLHLVIRTIGLARATTKIMLANLAYNMRRLVWIGGQGMSA